MRIVLSLIFVPLIGLEVLLCNVVQMLSLVLYPFSGAAFRAVNRNVARVWFSSLALFLEYLPGLQFVQTGDALPVKENAFVICNHQSGADIPAVIVLARRCRRTADLKWFVKDVIKWVPGIGWGMLFLDCLFVKRNWNADKDKIVATFERLRRNKVKFWILSFVEGTRLTGPKLARSQKYCHEAGLPVLQHVMSPRTRGFEATLEGLGSLADAVYDVTLAFEGFPTGKIPGFGALVFGPLHRVHIRVDRFPISAIPATREGRVSWVLERFTVKDKRLAEFYKTNRLD
ncbi:MAG: 1-acyl-sn-glycerol-3-phosphate acyltransferase [Bdellovibrionota bacterium]